ncbi:hypothetical protein ACQ1ZR_19955, partial [Enterococcus faecalis]
ERLLIFISFLLLSGLSLYFVYFQENFFRASDFRFHQNRVEGLALAIKNNDSFPNINYFLLGDNGYPSSLIYPSGYLY